MRPLGTASRTRVVITRLRSNCFYTSRKIDGDLPAAHSCDTPRSERVRVGRSVAVLTAATFVLSGCNTALWPNIQNDAALEPIRVESSSNSCLSESASRDYDTARRCALASLEEFTRLDASDGDFERIMGYALLGLGTATGSAIAVDVSRHILRGLAIGTAATLGLRTVVNASKQREIMRDGIHQLVCVIRAGDAARDAPTRLTSLGSASSASVAGLRPESQRAFNVAFTALQISAQRYYSASRSASDSAARNLMLSVLAIRANARDRLASSVGDVSDAAAQRNRVLDLIGNLLKARDEARKKAIELDGAIAAISSIDTNFTASSLSQLLDSSFIQQARNSSDDLDTILVDCTDASVLRLFRSNG